MFKRLLVAVDQRESRHPLIEFTAQLATDIDTCVRVLHIIEFAGRGCTAPIETPDEAERIVQEAVFALRMAGVGSEGVSRAALRHDVGSLIVKGAVHWDSDVIVMGTNKSRGLGRLLGHGVRERVIRKSPIPVLVAPATVAAKPTDLMTRLKTT